MIYWQLFVVFARVSLLAFGGVFGLLPEIEQSVVAEHHWLTHEAFVQSYVVGQFVPGPNMAMAPLIGYRVAGPLGALVAALGIYCGPIVLITVGSALYFRHKQKTWVRRTEAALRPLVFALILSSTGLFLRDELRGDWLLGLLVGVPIAWLNWTGRLPALPGVFLTGAAWWLLFATGWIN